MRLGTRLRLLTVAFILTAAIVFVGNAATDVVLGEPLLVDGRLGFIDAPDVAVYDVVFSGFPFFVLALVGERRPTMWIAGVALTIMSWGYAVWQIWRDSLTGFAGGANIGLGLVMMAAPFMIFLVLIGIGFVLDRHARQFRQQ